MEQQPPPIPYQFAPNAPRLAWPDGSRIAVWIIPNIEWVPWDKPMVGRGGPIPPDVKTWSIREYGARIGVWRLMEALDSVGVRASVALNALVCDHYPGIIEAGNARGWEWMGHGLTNAQPLHALDPETERSVILETLDRITKGTGQRPQGWLGPGLNETFLTAGYLAEAGLKYVADWPVDDRPFPFHSDKGDLVGLPYSLIHNDTRMYDGSCSPDQYRDQLCRIFDVLYHEGEQSATVLGIPLHPHLSGYPARAHALKEMLAYMKAHAGVWWATGNEIADAYEAQRASS